MTPRRGAEGAAAAAARAGVDSRPGHDSWRRWSKTAAINKNPVILVEAARHSLGRALIRPLLDEDGRLKVVTLDGSIEEECARTPTQHSHAIAPAGDADLRGAPRAGRPARDAGRPGSDGAARAAVLALRAGSI